MYIIHIRVVLGCSWFCDGKGRRKELLLQSSSSNVRVTRTSVGSSSSSSRQGTRNNSSTSCTLSEWFDVSCRKSLPPQESHPHWSAWRIVPTTWFPPLFRRRKRENVGRKGKQRARNGTNGTKPISRLSRNYLGQLSDTSSLGSAPPSSISSFPVPLERSFAFHPFSAMMFLSSFFLFVPLFLWCLFPCVRERKWDGNGWSIDTSPPWSFWKKANSPSRIVWFAVFFSYRRLF